MIFSNKDYIQRQFEEAVRKTSLEEVMQAFCEYICEEDRREFIGYYCDDHNCFPEEDE